MVREALKSSHGEHKVSEITFDRHDFFSNDGTSSLKISRLTREKKTPVSSLLLECGTHIVSYVISYTHSIVVHHRHKATSRNFYYHRIQMFQASCVRTKQVPFLHKLLSSQPVLHDG